MGLILHVCWIQQPSRWLHTRIALLAFISDCLLLGRILYVEDMLSAKSGQPCFAKPLLELLSMELHATV